MANFPYFALKTFFVTPTLQPSCRDSFNKGSRHMFSLRSKKITFQLSSKPLLNWCSYTCSMLLFLCYSRDWGYCLNDEPAEHLYKFPKLPAGTMYDANHQCRLQYGTDDTEICTDKEVCTTLKMSKHTYLLGYKTEVLFPKVTPYIRAPDKREYLVMIQDNLD